jgi:hypothetical protein
MSAPAPNIIVDFRESLNAFSEAPGLAPEAPSYFDYASDLIMVFLYWPIDVVMLCYLNRLGWTPDRPGSFKTNFNAAAPYALNPRPGGGLPSPNVSTKLTATFH